MGQHKYNPNVLLAQEGELHPKPSKMSSEESEKLVKNKLMEILKSKGLFLPLNKYYY